MADRAPENTNTKINSSEYPDPRLWLLASAKKEIFQPESIMRLNILGGHDNSDKIGAMRNMRIFEVGKNGEIILNFSGEHSPEKRQAYIQNMVTEYFAHVFRTSLVPMKISSKFTHEGREYDITKLAALPIFDTSGDKSQGTTSFYDIMQDETLGIEPKERAEILSYLGFLSDVSGLASTTIGASISLQNVSRVILSPSGVISTIQNDGSTLNHNLLDIYTAVRTSPTIQKQIEKLQETRKQKEALRESLDTESLFDGKILITYAPETFLAGRALIELHDTLRSINASTSVASSFTRQAGERMIKRVVVQTTEGTRVLTGLDLKGSKTYIKENIFKELLKAGIKYDAKSGKFIQPEVQALRRTLGKSLGEVREILKQPGLTQKEYDAMKKTLSSIGAEAIRSNQPIRKVLAKLMNSVDKFLLPLFFHEFSKSQNTIAFMDGLSDWAVFHYGAKLGAHVGDIPLAGPLTKIGGQALGGMIFGLGGLVAKKFGVSLISEGRRLFWRYGSDKDTGVYTDGKNTSGHNLTNWKIPELVVDGGNSLMGSDTDVGIKGRPELQSWIPEITMFQRKVNMGTAPWEWLGQSQGRTIYDWNKGVDLMKTRMSERLGDLLRVYKNKEGIFGDKGFIKEVFGMTDAIDRAGSRSKLLALVFKEILVADGTSGYFGDEVFAMTSLIEGEIKKNPNNPNTDNLLLIINNEINMMKIDRESLALQEMKLEGKKQELVNSIAKLKPHVSPERYNYISSLFGKMVRNEALHSPGKWDESIIVGTKSKKFVPSQENEWFQGLLDNTTKIVDDGTGKMICDILGNKDSIEIGQYFALLLDMMVNIKKEGEFIIEVKSGNPTGINWSGLKSDVTKLWKTLAPR